MWKKNYFFNLNFFSKTINAPILLLFLRQYSNNFMRVGLPAIVFADLPSSLKSLSMEYPRLSASFLQISSCVFNEKLSSCSSLETRRYNTARLWILLIYFLLTTPVVSFPQRLTFRNHPAMSP